MGELQVENRRQIEAVSGIDSASEINGSVLAASPAKTLKLAMIFEVCRWVKDKTRDWQVIAADTLDLAAQARGLLRRGKQGSRRNRDLIPDCSSVLSIRRVPIDRRHQSRSGPHLPGALPALRARRGMGQSQVRGTLPF